MAWAPPCGQNSTGPPPDQNPGSAPGNGTHCMLLCETSEKNAPSDQFVAKGCHKPWTWTVLPSEISRPRFLGNWDCKRRLDETDARMRGNSREEENGKIFAFICCSSKNNNKSTLSTSTSTNNNTLAGWAALSSSLFLDPRKARAAWAAGGPGPSLIGPGSPWARVPHWPCAAVPSVSSEGPPVICADG